MILSLIGAAVEGGARPAQACQQLGLSLRCVQRWRKSGADDLRSGPRTRPANALTAKERCDVLAVVNSAEYANLSPKQIVPRLADQGRYLASESSIYRILRAEGQLAHRSRAKVPTRHRPVEHVAVAPNQVWSWDITYLKTACRGSFYYLYLIEDVWSRKIVGWAVHDDELNELAAKLMLATCMRTGVDAGQIVLHSDNGGPMKGSTMLATLQRLGVVPSFSRPGVSDDNPFSEALFRTLKYRPEYPRKPFASIGQARHWVAGFVAWYNDVHRHSSIRFVTPEQRHQGHDIAVLARRAQLYEKARRRRPERWARGTRNWTPAGAVYLNPQRRGDTDAPVPVAELAS